MLWNRQDYPRTMKSLDEKTRNRAIEIANMLVDEAYDEGYAIFYRDVTGEAMGKNEYDG